MSKIFGRKYRPKLLLQANECPEFSIGNILQLHIRHNRTMVIFDENLDSVHKWWYRIILICLWILIKYLLIDFWIRISREIFTTLKYEVKKTIVTKT